MGGDRYSEGASLPTTEHIHGPWKVTLGWQVIDGRPECADVHITAAGQVAEPITGTLIRQLGIPMLIAADRAAMAGDAEPALPPGMRRSTAERFRRVAKVYRQALSEGRNPVQAVAAEFGITGPSASNLVARTRAAGFLPPASPGVPTA